MKLNLLLDHIDPALELLQINYLSDQIITVVISQMWRLSLSEMISSDSLWDFSPKMSSWVLGNYVKNIF